MPPWPVCAGHREAQAAPLRGVSEQWEHEAELIVTEVTDGVCALAAFGNCCDDPVVEIPVLDVTLLDRGS
jgi:hypothetical protein